MKQFDDMSLCVEMFHGLLLLNPQTISASEIMLFTVTRIYVLLKQFNDMSLCVEMFHGLLLLNPQMISASEIVLYVTRTYLFLMKMTIFLMCQY